MFKIFNNSIEKSGNNTTLTRLSNLLDLEESSEIQNKMIGIHAYKFGKMISNRDLIYILIIGGTDINIDVYDTKKRSIIIDTILKSKYVVCFSNYIKQEIENLVSIDKQKIRVIAQSITFIKPENFNLKSYIKRKYSINNINKIYLVVGNIRKVKGCNFLDEIANILFEKDIFILFIGKVIEKETKVKAPYLFSDDLTQKQIFACYEQADGLINISESEGMASAILEAMIYKCPVYVRHNKGNLSIIEDNQNGFVFKTPKDFLEKIKLDNVKIIENAYRYVLEYHNPKEEKEKYLELIL